MKRLPFSQHGMLVDLGARKPHDYSYPNGYRWITNTIRALFRKGLCEGWVSEPRLTQLGKDYLAEHSKPVRHPRGRKHPIAANWTSDKLYPS